MVQGATTCLIGQCIIRLVFFPCAPEDVWHYNG